jgi:hypothetical protein
MTTQSAATRYASTDYDNTITEQRHPSPNLGILALIFTALKLASIGEVSILTGNPAFPSPQQPPTEIVSYTLVS